MTLKEKVAEILKDEQKQKEIMKLFRWYENEIVMANSIIESIEEILDDKQVSDFMLSFPVVRCVDDLMQSK